MLGICFKINFGEEDQPNMWTVSKAEIKERSRCFTTGPATWLCFFPPEAVQPRHAGAGGDQGEGAGPAIRAAALSAPPGLAAHAQLPGKAGKAAAGAWGSQNGCCRFDATNQNLQGEGGALC